MVCECLYSKQSCGFLLELFFVLLVLYGTVPYLWAILYLKYRVGFVEYLSEVYVNLYGAGSL